MGKQNIQVLDPCCGSKMHWFDKKNDLTLFGDIRSEQHVLCDGRTLNVNPSTVMDFTDLPLSDASVNLISFDPPHLIRAGKTSWMRLKYGCLERENWRDALRSGFNECWRVLRPGGTLIFKWNETQIKIREITDLFPVDPLFGHTTTNNLKTHWMVFYKPESESL